MFGRKGQGAMEYLMTYGWAILVVMIVGIVMWQLGIFNMGSTTTTASGFSKIKPQLSQIGVDAETGDVQLIFTNGAGTRITLTGVGVSGGNGISCDQTSAAALNGQGLLAAEFVAGAVLGAGENFLVYLPACAAQAPYNPGDVYDMTVVFRYSMNLGGSTVSQTDTGVLRGPYQ